MCPSALSAAASARAGGSTAAAAFSDAWLDEDLTPREAIGALSSLLEDISLVDPRSIERATSVASSLSSGAEAHAAFAEGIASGTRHLGALRGLATLIGSTALPARIETFDISHLYGEHTMGAWSVLDRGCTPLHEYGCVRVTGVTKADDCAAIKHTLKARFASLTRERQSESSFETKVDAPESPGGRERMPDVLLIDGGRPQLAAAQQALAEIAEMTETSGGTLVQMPRVLALAKREEAYKKERLQHRKQVSHRQPGPFLPPMRHTRDSLPCITARSVLPGITNRCSARRPPPLRTTPDLCSVSERIFSFQIQEIYLPGGGPPVALPLESPTLMLLRRLRDEAHVPLSIRLIE